MIDSKNRYDVLENEKSEVEKLKLFATDLDGTLLDDDKEVSEENIAAIQELSRSGCHIAIATGRSIESASELFGEVLGLSEGYLLCLNGSVVYDFGAEELLKQEFVASEVSEELIEIAEAWQTAMIFSAEDGGGLYSPADSSHEITDPDRFYRLDSKEEALAFVRNTPVYKTVYSSSDHEKLRRLYPYLESRGHQPIFSDVAFEEILPENGGKETALKWLAEYLGLEPREVCAIGDQENDLGMLRYAGTSIAMSNAICEVKDTASMLTKSNNDSGVAFAISKLCQLQY